MPRAARVSVKNAQRAVARDEREHLKAIGGAGLASPTVDSFQNFQQGMGMGTDNPMSDSRYGFNPISRDRTHLEWIHRGSWLGGIAIDTLADDMTRMGIDYVTELKPEDTDKLDRRMTQLNTWPTINEVIKWGNLYGGAIGVVLIDGQDLRTPLREQTVGIGQYKGLLALDRWMVEPSLEDLVTEYGPHLGLPKYYRVSQNAPALRGCAIHYSRIAFRIVGIELPYSQRLMENLWGISVLERMYDRMVAFDSASTGVAQLVYKAYLRTLKVKDLRNIVSAGNKPMQGLYQYVNTMRRFQGIEGITIVDAEDEFEVQEHSAFSGLGDALLHLGQQVSGSLQVPLVRLFGQSPAGLNSTGESDIRTYYDKVRQKQEKELHSGVTLCYRLGARSEGIALPDNFSIEFASLWDMTDTDKASVASTASTAIQGAHDSGLIGRKTALKELRQSSRVTGIFTNITQKMIAEADDDIEPPPPESGGGGEGIGGGLPPPPGAKEPVGGAPEGGGEQSGTQPTQPTQAKQSFPKPPDLGEDGGKTGPEGQAKTMDESYSCGGSVQCPPPRRRPTSR